MADDTDTTGTRRIEAEAIKGRRSRDLSSSHAPGSVTISVSKGMLLGLAGLVAAVGGGGGLVGKLAAGSGGEPMAIADAAHRELADRQRDAAMREQERLVESARLNQEVSDRLKALEAASARQTIGLSEVLDELRGRRHR